MNSTIRFPWAKSLLSVFMVLVAGWSWAYQIPENPKAMVVDYSNTLSTGEVSMLEANVEAYRDSTSSEIAIVLIPQMEDGDDIEALAHQWAETWKIGQEGKNNGVLILISIGNHQMDIEVGRGMEAVVSDGDAKRIIETILKPNFRKNQYFQGLSEAVDRIKALASGEFVNDNPKGLKKTWKWVKVIFIVLVILLILIFRRRGGGMTGGRKGFNSMPPIFWGGFGGGGGSGWGGGSSSGGFGGFGGGSFGGGGASGSW